MPYSCNTCKIDHPTDHVCEKPKVNACCLQHDKELMERFNKFNNGYGEITTAILLSLRRHLFEPSTLQGTMKEGD